jgi:hypothetical protein
VDDGISTAAKNKRASGKRKSPAGNMPESNTAKSGGRFAISADMLSILGNLEAATASVFVIND